jgi:hypothetical protein
MRAHEFITEDEENWEYMRRPMRVTDVVTSAANLANSLSDKEEAELLSKASKTFNLPLAGATGLISQYLRNQMTQKFDNDDKSIEKKYKQDLSTNKPKDEYTVNATRSWEPEKLRFSGKFIQPDSKSKEREKKDQIDPNSKRNFLRPRT